VIGHRALRGTSFFAVIVNDQNGRSVKTLNGFKAVIVTGLQRRREEAGGIAESSADEVGCDQRLVRSGRTDD